MKNNKVMHTAPENIFTINYSNLQDRLDAEFYSPFYTLERTKTFVPLKRVTSSIIHPPEYPREFTSEGIQLIRSQNVRPLGINLRENPVYFSQDFLNNKHTITPEIGDILVVRSGVNAGDTAVVESKYPDVIIGADTLLCKCNSKLYPKFLQVYFFTDIGKRQMVRHITGATNKHLNSSNLGKVLIPLLDLNEQKECIDIYEYALNLNIKKENEAKVLLSKIDDYLLNELGIELPEKDDSLESRIFVTKFSEISGGRWDVLYYASELKKYIISVKSGRYPFSKLGDIAVVDWGNTNITKASYTEEGYFAYSSAGQDGNLPFYENDGDAIILSAIGARCGKCFLNISSKWTAIKNTITIIPTPEVNLEYIYSILDFELFWEKSGGAQPFITLKSAKERIIPIPPIEKQNEIAEKISSIRQQVKQLQQEANDMLEQAKKRVEKKY
ncbi:MAG: restriction endonuclease subunit S [Holosporales bacterium]|nr:restriction endonuclease subunit S [Holosporales bacterium]